MEALKQLQAYGFRAELSAPDKIRLTWTRPDPPDPTTVEPLLADLKARKAEAIEALRHDVEIDLATRTMPATIYQGRPTSEAVDAADAMLEFIAAQPSPVPEGEIIAAVRGDPVLSRNVLRRLAVDGIAEALPGGLFGIPEYPRKPAELPTNCPLTGAPFPETCRFQPNLFKRLVAEGVLQMGGPCPLRRVCRFGREK